MSRWRWILSPHDDKHDLSEYGVKETKFYFANQRQTDGDPMYTDLSGEAHAVECVKMAEREGQGPWQWTFVTDEGYKAFSST